MKNIGAEKIAFGLLGIITVFAIIITLILSQSDQKNQILISSYTVKDTQRPRVEISKSFQDIGKMKVSDEKTAKFTIENKGTKPLQLFKISSSCNCTFGQVIIGKEKSPEFSMHSSNNWTGTIPPNQKADLLVIYKPSIMPVSGIITRDVYVQTNDPANPNLTFTIKTFVE